MLTEPHRRIQVLEATPDNGGYRLDLACSHTEGPDAHTVRHHTWRKYPAKYVMYCDTCAVVHEVLEDYWASR